MRGSPALPRRRVVGAGAYHSLAAATVSTGPSVYSYSYDFLYRLTSVGGASSAAYGYDPAGNRSTKGTTPYSYDRADRITAVGSTGYTVNANGNLTARGSDAFGYDQANRLKTASVAGVSSTYAYDGDGKRSSKAVGAASTAYTYDVNASLPVLLDDGTRKYVWGLGLAYAVDSSGSPLVYHSDGLGSVRALTDSSGSIVQTYLYDEYGLVLSSQGSISQPFGYTGEQRDEESAFMYLRARMYDPYLNRFIQSDPIAAGLHNPQGLNRYVYGLNNPFRYTDPSGLSSQEGSYDNDCAKKLFGDGGFVFDAKCMGYDVITITQVEVRIGPITFAVPGISFAKPGKGGDTDPMRGRDALDRERRYVRFLQRGMTEEQRELFQRLIEETKESVGMGGGGTLSKETLMEIRDAVLKGRPY